MFLDRLNLILALAFALLGMFGSAALYISGHMAWWVCLLLNAFGVKSAEK